jgi:tetratricopeptide (TPR) repeat protein
MTQATRCRRWTRRTWLVVLALGCALPGGATAQVDHYRHAYDAFEAGAYQEALEHLMIVYTNLQHSPAARPSGQQAAALHYDLGATYFRLGRFPAAARQFNRIVDDPGLGACARFNLGVIEAAQGNRSAALAHYLEARARAEDGTPLRARATAKLTDPLAIADDDAPAMLGPHFAPKH